jgi:hypothetical protein
MAGVGKIFGGPHQPVALAAHLPAQPVIGVDRGGDRSGFGGEPPRPA